MSILEIRQMMAEAKFFDAEKAIHLLLHSHASSDRDELLALFIKALEKQNKNLPALVLIELAESELKSGISWNINQYLEKIGPQDQQNYYARVQLLKISHHSSSGQMEELYRLISAYQMMLIERHVPALPGLITEVTARYFANDFQLQLQSLVIILMKGDLARAETMIKSLIFSSIEKSSQRGMRKKYQAISDILKIPKESHQLEIYKNFCELFLNGVKDKKDYKRLVEMLLYFDDFKFQTLLMDLFDRLDFEEQAQDYSKILRSNSQFDFIYFEKYFAHLKKYFVSGSKIKSQTPESKHPELVDLNLEKLVTEEILSAPVQVEENEDDALYTSFIKHQNYSENQILDLAVSFLQSEMPKVALAATKLAMEKSQSDASYLKIAYIQFTALLLLGEYRSALDLSFLALEKAQSEDDLKSFMYGQAEVYLRLKETARAKAVLLRLLAIDSTYRLAKERLEKINEI